jgi:uncharacterized membrane protein
MPWKWAVALVVFCAALNAAGFMWHFFEPIPLYDEIAHFVTPFVLVALTAEIIYRAGGDDVFFNTPWHAIITGIVIGLVGAGGWEVVEQILASAGAQISNAPGDTVFDVLLGVVGGAVGAWFADRYLDRLFGRPRWASHPQERTRRVR